MNYYEELGVPTTAANDEIRKAYRILSRLVHPDYQTDPALRDAAEIQMRRLTGMIDTLTNLASRQQYDTLLHASHGAHHRTAAPPPIRVGTLHPAFPGHTFRGSPLSFIVTAISAVVLTSATLWFFAGDLTSLQRTTAAPAPPGSQSPAPAKPPPSKPPPARREPPVSRTHATANHVDAAGQPLPTVDAANVSSHNAGQEHPIATTAADPAAAPLSGSSGSMRVADLPPTSTAARITAPAAAPEPTLAGMWFYAAQASKPPAPGMPFYEPEFIQMRVWIDHSSVRGQYAARYRITDRPISAEVLFDFEGALDAGGTFSWRSADGSSGTIQLKQLKPQSLQVDWRTNSFGARLGLAAGSAVLIKRVQL